MLAQGGEGKGAFKRRRLIGQVGELHADVHRHDRQVQGIEASEPSHCETRRLGCRGDPVAIGAGDDETTEHEKEIHGHITVADDRPVVEVRCGGQVKQHHQHGAESATGVEGAEAAGILCHTMQQLIARRMRRDTKGAFTPRAPAGRAHPDPLPAPWAGQARARQ